jgi:hypothetical protein
MLTSHTSIYIAFSGLNACLTFAIRQLKMDIEQKMVEYLGHITCMARLMSRLSAARQRAW